MKRCGTQVLKHLTWFAILVGVITTGNLSSALADPHAQAGPYGVDLTTDPVVIPVSQPTRLVLKITDGAGKPVEGARVSAISQMPGMAMGEREEAALPQAGQPGMYIAPARFAMEGAYTATVRITGPLGSATGAIPLHTGQTTVSHAAGRGGPVVPYGQYGAWLPWLASLRSNSRCRS